MMQMDTLMTDHPVTAYAKAVSSGEIVAGPHVRNACARHLRDLERGGDRGLYFDEVAANRAFGFYRDVLRLGGGRHEGKPFLLLPWQQFVVGSLFGWKRADGARRFRTVYVETAKGSGKSPLAAGVGLLGLTADKEPRAEIYAAAVKRDQAKIMFRDAVSMVEQSQSLGRRLHLTGKTEKTAISNLKSGSFFRPIATENTGAGQSGPRPHVGILDEVHEHKTDAMVEMMVAGVKGRRQPIIFMITNSGSDKQSVCWTYHDYATKVCASVLDDDEFFAYVCALDDKDDPFRDRSCWAKANPSLGQTIDEGYLEKQVREARGMPSKQNVVLRLNFCRWTDADQAWIGKEAWESCEDETITAADLVGEPCVGGLDLSSKKDLTALALYFPKQNVALVEFWKPADTLLEAEDRDGVPYTIWRDQGHLTATPGKVVDYAFVAKRLGQISETYELRSVRFDRWRIDLLEVELDKRSVDVPLVQYGQGFKDMSPAVEELEKLILGDDFRVIFNPILRWNVASATIEEDASENRKFNKRKSTGRIDGLVALAMATAGGAEKPAPKSYVEASEMMVL